MFQNKEQEKFNWIDSWGEGLSGYSLCPHVMPQMKEAMGKFERMTCYTMPQMKEAMGQI